MDGTHQQFYVREDNTSILTSQPIRCSALELIKKGIRVNSVNPGVIETEFFATSGMSESQVKGFYEV